MPFNKPAVALGAKPASALNLGMAVAAGFAVANNYYNQPMLGIMERDLPGPITSFVPTATQLGYAVGLFLLVPLGDLVERKRLIVLQFGGLVVALALAAMAPSGAALVLASLLVGLLSTVAQQIVTLAANLATPGQRGATVGTVMAGLLCGILLSRTLAGFVATHGGWRDMFWFGILMAVAAGALMTITLPRSTPDSPHTYASLLHSMGGLWIRFAALRRAAIMQALLFAGFSAFWTILALYLQGPRFSLGADVAGLFGIVGAVGILTAPVAGRISDRWGPNIVIVVSAVLSLVAWAVLGALGSIPGLIAGVIFLDMGVQGALIANQQVIYALAPEARARLNTILMGSTFLGGAAGSAGATLAWNTGGWIAVVAFGTAVSALGLLIQVVGRRFAG